MGRHGLVKNRMKKLRELQGKMFSKDEDELDSNDAWRYCRAPVNAFNHRRHTVIIPSWLHDADWGPGALPALHEQKQTPIRFARMCGLQMMQCGAQMQLGWHSTTGPMQPMSVPGQHNAHLML